MLPVPRWQPATVTSPWHALPLAQALKYRGRVEAAAPPGSGFAPLMTLYLTDNTPPDEVDRATAAGMVAFKLYPAGATTNSGARWAQGPHIAGVAASSVLAATPSPAATCPSLPRPRADSGVTSLDKVLPALRAMARLGMPLLLHGEVTDDAVDMFDREAVFIREKLVRPRARRRQRQGARLYICGALQGLECGAGTALQQLAHGGPHRSLRATPMYQVPLLDRVPDLRIVMEHITTADAAEFVAAAPANVAATVTPQHMLLNRNALFVVRGRHRRRPKPDLCVEGMPPPLRPAAPDTLLRRNATAEGPPTSQLLPTGPQA